MISLVIPIFNEEATLAQLHARIVAASASWGDSYEAILVDDGSEDNSLQMMREIAARNPAFVVIKLSRNFGHQAAISAGIMQARGDAVVVMDGDLQDPPEELSRFLDKWREGYDVVYAVRQHRKEHLFKRTAYALFYRILKLVSHINIPLDSGDFCVMDKKVVRVLNREMPERIRFVRGLRAYAGFKQIGLAYDRPERAAGTTKYSFRKLLKLALDGIFDFSVFPLRIAAVLGFVMSVSSLGLACVYLVARFLHMPIFGRAPGDVTGFTTLAVSMFFLGGMILLVLGCIGEYLGRIYTEVKQRPFYIVEDIFRSPGTG